MLLYLNLSNLLFEWNTLLVVLTICMGTCNYLAILYKHLCLLIVRDPETRSGISGSLRRFMTLGNVMISNELLYLW
jgi:hypothetical protein